MKSIEVGTARVVVAAIALTVAALAYLDAQGSFAGEAAAQAAAERSSRASEAEAELAGTGLRHRMEVALGDAFGGIWFEPETAQVHVGVTSAASRGIAAAVATRTGLSAIVTETPVESTQAELEAAQAAWNQRLADLFERGLVGTSLLPDRNAVRLELGSSVSPARRAALEREADAAAVNVLIDVSPHPRLQVVPGFRCNKFVKFKANCDPTIVSAVGIDSEKDGKGNRTSCTAGPMARLKDDSTAAKATKTYLVTAGHCINSGGGENKKWYAYNQKEEEKEIGTAGPFLTGKTDVGVIEVTTNYWANANDIIPVIPALAIWNSGADFNPTKISKVEKPVKGVKTCFAGQRSEWKCGPIEEEGVSFTFDGQPAKTEKLFKVELENNGKGGKTDSGGPFFTSSFIEYVEGTFVGFEVEDAKKEEGNVVFFQGLETSFAELEKVKSLSLELLRTANEKRILPKVFSADQYPATVSASTAEDGFTAFGATVICTEGGFDGLLSEPEAEQEGRLTLEVAPTYPNCTSGGLPAKFSNNECKYELTPQELVTEGHYVADVAVVCPEGKPGIQLRVYANHTNLTSETAICTLTIPPQSGLQELTLTNSSGDIVADSGAIEGVKVKIHRSSIVCPSSGTENETTSGVYDILKSLTFAGTQESEPVNIDLAGG